MDGQTDIHDKAHGRFSQVCEGAQNDSVITVRPISRRNFNTGRLAGVHQHNTVNKGVKKFRTTASAPNKKHGARVRTVRTTDNMQGVRAAVCRSPRRQLRSYFRVPQHNERIDSSDT